MSEKNDIKNENIRVVIDTGVWISFLITGDEDLLVLKEFNGIKVLNFYCYLIIL